MVRFEHDRIKKEELLPQEWEELNRIRQEWKVGFELTNPDEIKLSNYVGLITFSTGRFLEILPKVYRSTREKEITEGRRLITLFILELLFPNLKELGATGKLDLSIPFLEIITLITLRYTEKKIIQPGLYRSYQREKVLSKSLSGKLLFSETLTRNPFQREKLILEKEFLTANVPENRVLLNLSEFAVGRFASKELKSLAGRITLFLMSLGVERERKIKETLKKLKLNRMSEHYRPPVTLARFLFLGESTGSKTKNEQLSFLYDMNRLFEEFVARSLPEAQAQHEEMIGPSFSLRPDLILTVNGKRVVLDTKWKKTSTRKIDRCDKFQILTYIYTLEERWEKPFSQGILIYPELEDREIMEWNVSPRRRLKAVSLKLKEILRNTPQELPVEDQIERLKKGIEKRIKSAL